MTLPSSLPLSMSDIATELGTSLPLNLLDADVLDLAEKSAPISFSDLLGKEWRSAAALSNGININSGTASGVDFGAAHTYRRIVCIVTEDGSGGALTATIGGVTATVHAQAGHFGGATGLHVAVFSAIVPTGTSGSVVITSGGSVRRLAVFRLVRFDVLASGTDETQVTTGSVSVEVSTAAGGVVIGGYTGSTNTVATGVTWTNATEIFDTGATVRHSGAWVSSTSSGTLTVSATQGAIADSGNDLAVVSFQPS